MKEKGHQGEHGALIPFWHISPMDNPLDNTKSRLDQREDLKVVFTNSMSNLICKPHPTGRDSLRGKTKAALVKFYFVYLVTNAVPFLTGTQSRLYISRGQYDKAMIICGEAKTAEKSLFSNQE